MSNIRAAYRYATAILIVGEETRALDEVYRDFQMMEKIIRESAGFRAFLKSPVVNSEKKKKVLREIFSASVTPLTLGFVLLLASKGRESLLPEIVRQFYHLRDERMGILDVKIEAVVPLTKAQEQEIVGRLERATKKKVRLTTVINAALKGGFRVQAEDRVWDASVRHELAVLKERFIQGVA